MKIVLLCVGGISSSILAKRLHNYSQDNQKGDDFQAERYGTISIGSLDCDLYLIAPQIRKLISETPGFEMIPAERILYVSETDYSNINVEGLYGQIDTLRSRLESETKAGGKPVIETGLILKGVMYSVISIICYALIRLAESTLKVDFMFARILLPLIVLMRYADELSESKKEAKVLHLANIFCLFMMMTPFTLIPGFVMEDSFSMIVIPELSIIEYGLIIVLTAVLYTLYNLWEDWYLEKNRFMMRMIRDSLCSGLFYMFVIAVKLIVNFFVKT